jgi:hypothetical protein
MDDEESCDVLEEASSARLSKQFALNNQNYVIWKNWNNLRVNENQ